MMKLKHNKKSKLLIAALVLMLAVAVSGTVAYIIDITGSVKNTFTPAEFNTNITESFDGTVKSNVRVNVTGDVEAYVRARIVVTWQDDEGNVCSKTPVLGEGNDYTLTIGSGWEEHNGYYYYSKTVKPGDATDVLITKCEVLTSADQPDGYRLHVEILSQAVQAEPIKAARDLWGYVPGQSSTTTE